MRRGGRAVECGGLENRFTDNLGDQGSNPCPSATAFYAVLRTAFLIDAAAACGTRPCPSSRRAWPEGQCACLSGQFRAPQAASLTLVPTSAFRSTRRSADEGSSARKTEQCGVFPKSRSWLPKRHLDNPTRYTTENMLQMSAADCSKFAVVYEFRRRGGRPAGVSPGRDWRRLPQRVYNRRFAANEHAELQQNCGCIPIRSHDARGRTGGQTRRFELIPCVLFTPCIPEAILDQFNT